MSQDLPNFDGPSPYIQVPVQTASEYASEQPPLDPDKPHWGPGAGLAVWAASFTALLFVPLLAVLIYAVIEQVSGRPIPLTNPELTNWVMSPGSLLVQILASLPAHLLTLGVAWAVVTRIGKKPFWASLGWSWQGVSSLSHAAFVFGVVIVMLAVNFGVEKIVPEGDNSFRQILATSFEVRIAIALLAVLTAPLVEEVVFRGVLYSGMRKKFPASVSVLFVTLLFAGVHVPQYWGAWASITGVTLLSLVLTLIRAKTKSIAPCVWIHLINNTVGAIAILASKWD